MLTVCRIEGAAVMSQESVICEVEMVSGRIHKIRSFVKNAKIIEQNTRVQQNVNLLVERPEHEGYLAILMLPVQPGSNASSSTLIK